MIEKTVKIIRNGAKDNMSKSISQITIPKEAIGLHACFIAKRKFDPIKEPKEYTKLYKKIFKKLLKKNPTLFI